MDIIRRLFKKRGRREVGIHDEYIEDVYVEEADDEYVLLKVFSKENPEVGFSYAINRIDELKVAVTSLTKERDAIEKVNAALKDDIEKVFQFKNQMEDLKEELMKRERELSEKSIEIETLVRTSARLGVETDTLKSEIEKKDRQIKNYLEQMEILKQDPKLIELEKKNRINANKIASLEDEAKNLRVTIEKQRTTFSVKQDELEHYKEMAASQGAELSTMKANWWGANTQLKDIKRQLEEKEEVLSSKEGMIKELLIKSNKLFNELNELKKDLEVKTKLLTDYEKRSEEFKKGKDELLKQKEKNDLLTIELKEKATELSEKESRLRKLERRLEGLLSLEDEVKKLSTQVEKHKDTLHVVRSEADLYKKMTDSIDTELKRLMENFLKTSNQTKSLKKEIEIKSGILAAKDGTIKELTEESGDMAAELDMLKKQIEESATAGGSTAASTPSKPSPPLPKAEDAPKTPHTSKAPPTTGEARGPPAPKTEEPASVKKPVAETPAPKVSSNESKIKLLEIERRSILKMLDRPGIKDTSLGKKYQGKLAETSLKIKELKRG